MPISNIALIFIRLYAIKLLVGGLASIAGMLIMIDNPIYDDSAVFWSFLPNFIVIGCGALLWMIGPWFSRVLTKGGNGELSLGSVTREDLITTAILGLGVYFIMASFAKTVSWVHFFATNHDTGGFHMQRSPSYYDLTENLLTMIAGIALAITCRTWARRLSATKPSEQIASCNHWKRRCLRRFYCSMNLNPERDFPSRF